ncbi:MAG: hypothetical protein ACLGG3_02490 [Alphaproteobacteria bacterium]|jgi:hypothetical protein
MATPEGLRTPKRLALAVPLLLAVLVFGAMAIYGWTHFAAKTPAPQSDASAEETATARTEPSRGPYEPVDDLVEPNLK